MIGYILDPWSMETIESAEVSAYDLPIEAFNGSTGTVTFGRRLSGDYARYILALPDIDAFFCVTDTERGNGKETTLTIKDPTALFSEVTGDIGYLTAMGNSYTMSDLFAHSFKLKENVSYPAQFRLSKQVPKFAVLSTSYSFGGNPPTEDDIFIEGDVPNGKKYPTLETMLRYIQTHGNRITYKLYYKPLSSATPESVPTEPNNSYIGITITIADSDPIPIVFNDGHTELTGENYEDDVVSAYIDFATYVSGSNEYTRTIGYVLQADGELSRLDTKLGYPAADNQIQGRTAINYARYTSEAAVPSETDVYNAAVELFASNVYKHKITFRSDYRYYLNQAVKLIIDDTELDTLISSVRLEKGDNRYIYTCGDLPVTAAENMRASSWSYGKRKPANPRKGQLFILT